MQRLKEIWKNLPVLKITGIHEKKEILEEVATQLRVEAKNLNFHLQFNSIVRTMERLDLEEMSVVKGEPLAISSVLQLLTLLATDDAMVYIKSSPGGIIVEKDVCGKNPETAQI